MFPISVTLHFKAVFMSIFNVNQLLPEFLNFGTKQTQREDFPFWSFVLLFLLKQCIQTHLLLHLHFAEVAIRILSRFHTAHIREQLFPTTVKCMTGKSIHLPTALQLLSCSFISWSAATPLFKPGEVWIAQNKLTALLMLAGCSVGTQRYGLRTWLLVDGRDKRPASSPWTPGWDPPVGAGCWSGRSCTSSEWNLAGS